MALNHKQERFCREYLIDLSPRRAAERAGYEGKTAGAALMRNPAVHERLSELMDARAKRTEITADRVLRELARVAFVNPTDLLDMDTATVRQDATADDRAVIAGVKVKITPVRRKDEDGGEEALNAVEREVKLASKLKALELLARHLGLYEKAKNEPEADGATGVVVLPEVAPPPPPPEEGHD